MGGRNGSRPRNFPFPWALSCEAIRARVERSLSVRTECLRTQCRVHQLTHQLADCLPEILPAVCFTNLYVLDFIDHRLSLRFILIRYNCIKRTTFSIFSEHRNVLGEEKSYGLIPIFEVLTMGWLGQYDPRCECLNLVSNDVSLEPHNLTLINAFCLPSSTGLSWRPWLEGACLSAFSITKSSQYYIFHSLPRNLTWWHLVTIGGSFRRISKCN